MEHADQSLELRSINSIRTLAIDAVQKANSGHPGLPLGAAPMAYALWQRHLRHNPRNPHWPDRDRFVLSAGHGSMLLYCLLYLTGYDLTLDDLTASRSTGRRRSRSRARTSAPVTPRTAGRCCMSTTATPTSTRSTPRSPRPRTTRRDRR